MTINRLINQSINNYSLITKKIFLSLFVSFIFLGISASHAEIKRIADELLLTVPQKCTAVNESNRCVGINSNVCCPLGTECVQNMKKQTRCYTEPRKEDIKIDYLTLLQAVNLKVTNILKEAKEEVGESIEWDEYNTLDVKKCNIQVAQRGVMSLNCGKLNSNVCCASQNEKCIQNKLNPNYKKNQTRCAVRKDIEVSAEDVTSVVNIYDLEKAYVYISEEEKSSEKQYEECETEGRFCERNALCVKYDENIDACVPRRNEINEENIKEYTREVFSNLTNDEKEEYDEVNTLDVKKCNINVAGRGEMTLNCGKLNPNVCCEAQSEKCIQNQLNPNYKKNQTRCAKRIETKYTSEEVEEALSAFDFKNAHVAYDESNVTKEVKEAIKEVGAENFESNCGSINNFCEKDSICINYNNKQDVCIPYNENVIESTSNVKDSTNNTDTPVNIQETNKILLSFKKSDRVLNKIDIYQYLESLLNNIEGSIVGYEDKEDFVNNNIDLDNTNVAYSRVNTNKELLDIIKNDVDNFKSCNLANEVYCSKNAECFSIENSENNNYKSLCISYKNNGSLSSFQENLDNEPKCCDDGYTFIGGLSKLKSKLGIDLVPTELLNTKKDTSNLTFCVKDCVIDPNKRSHYCEVNTGIMPSDECCGRACNTVFDSNVVPNTKNGTQPLGSDIKQRQLLCGVAKDQNKFIRENYIKIGYPRNGKPRYKNCNCNLCFYRDFTEPINTMFGPDFKHITKLECNTKDGEEACKMFACREDCFAKYKNKDYNYKQLKECQQKCGVSDLRCTYDNDNLCTIASKNLCPKSYKTIPTSEVISVDSSSEDKVIWGNTNDLISYIKNYVAMNECTDINIAVMDHSNNLDVPIHMKDVIEKCIGDKCRFNEFHNLGCSTTCSSSDDACVAKMGCCELQLLLERTGQESMVITGNAVNSSVDKLKVPSYKIKISKDGCEVMHESCSELTAEPCSVDSSNVPRCEDNDGNIKCLKCNGVWKMIECPVLCSDRDFAKSYPCKEPYECISHDGILNEARGEDCKHCNELRNQTQCGQEVRCDENGKKFTSIGIKDCILCNDAHNKVLCGDSDFCISEKSDDGIVMEIVGRKGCLQCDDLRDKTKCGADIFKDVKCCISDDGSQNLVCDSKVKNRDEILSIGVKDINNEWGFNIIVGDIPDFRRGKAGCKKCQDSDIEVDCSFDNPQDFCINDDGKLLCIK